MFKSVGFTWNPISGCTHACKYCWARHFAMKGLSPRTKKAFSFTPLLHEKCFTDKFPEDGSWIFVCSISDLFCDGVKDDWIEKILTYINKNTSIGIDGLPTNKFLLQTKNPSRMLDFWYLIQPNKDKYVLGTTLESTEDTGTTKAPIPSDRAHTMANFKSMGYKTFLSLEPLADFDLNIMEDWISGIKPECIEIGLENYTNVLVKPSKEKLILLVRRLNFMGYPYLLKDNLKWLEEY